MAGAWQFVDYRDYRYQARRVEVREADDAPVVRCELAVRSLVTAEGRHLVHKSVPREAGRVNPGLYLLLDREVRAGARLLRRFPADAYPAELSRMVGYDIDGEEPFVLVERYRGVPVADRAGQLLTEQQHAFAAGLFRALRLLEAAKLVHGGLTPDTVWWDDGRVQVGGFEHAVLIGEPRVRNGKSRWCSPAQHAAEGAASPADDLWSAGAVVLEAVTGEPPGSQPVPERFGAAVGELLAGVFAPAAADRPTAAELLSRLRAPDTVPERGDSAVRDFARSRARFDEVLVAKLAPPAAEPPPPPPEPPRPAWRLAVTAAVVVAALVVWVVLEVAR
ncbi:hypothetical protein [Saccharothrix australiensis]|uniref:Serine/threonine protein kinase n=1 Tax=Saccharothrix australiensis TaxID=2072 RepID=A0A495W3R0_9PSEU|nr:hypothetical protein [Saccharothrix australiensis]RKT55395.1 serine/threonine protein kinase [Saccharothrix australiensis]